MSTLPRFVAVVVAIVVVVVSVSILLRLVGSGKTWKRGSWEVFGRSFTRNGRDTIDSQCAIKC